HPPAQVPGMRVGWASDPAFGPVDRDVTSTVVAAAEALRDLGCSTPKDTPSPAGSVNAAWSSADGT
ncbi:hypothetical protein, partial [Actinomadura rudentiformis]|uniref:hypothetical protein n=1 Tax=Actinomadura rudentiformis TaxID=359158 RepID=UPI001CEF8205